MSDQISIQYLNSKSLKRISRNNETYTAQNALTYECKNNASVGWAEVSDILTLFPHLTLDEHYALICYVYHHYHGVNGKVVAAQFRKSNQFCWAPKQPLTRYKSVHEDKLMSTNNIAKTIFYDEKTIDHYNRIYNAYLNNLNLNEAKQRLDTHGIGWNAINNVLDLFPHLALDENYRLYLYISQEYHGLYGHAAALPKNASPEPLLTAKENRYGFRDIILPESAVPPLNALYADGTPESYLEALYIKEIFSKMPRPYDKMQTTCLHNIPSTIQDNWNLYADIIDWRPRLLYKHDGSTPMLISVWLHERPVFGTLSGYPSTIELCQHHFEDSLGLRYYLSQRYDRLKPYKSFINEPKRYREDRHCCEALVNHIMIAEEII